jgi:hypothetical protein
MKFQHWPVSFDGVTQILFAQTLRHIGDDELFIRPNAELGVNDTATGIHWSGDATAVHAQEDIGKGSRGDSGAAISLRHEPKFLIRSS